MSEVKTHRLASVAKELNVGISTLVDHLHIKGFKDVAGSPNTKLSEEQFGILLRDFRSDKDVKDIAEQINIGKRKEEELTIKEALKEIPKEIPKETPQEIPKETPQETLKETPQETPKEIPQETPKIEEEIVSVKHEVEGPKIIGKIDLDKPKKKKVEEKPTETKPKQKEEPLKQTPPPVVVKTPPVVVLEEKPTKVVVKEELPKPATPIVEEIIRAKIGRAHV